MKLAFRFSQKGDIPRLKELWKLAFHDEDLYIHNYFTQYHQEKWMVVAESEGLVVGMTAIFHSVLQRGGESYPTAYLYAVATHPDYEKKGIASGILGYLKEILPQEGYRALSTVPAEPSLHNFFGRNGFLPYFMYDLLKEPTATGQGQWISLTAEEYGQKRAEYFRGCDFPYVQWTAEALSYQASVCALGQGGMYALPGAEGGETLMILEQGGEGIFVVKEVLCLGKTVPSLTPGTEGEVLQWRGVGIQDVVFGMLQWLGAPPEDWKAEERGYLGLAFD